MKMQWERYRGGWRSIPRGYTVLPTTYGGWAVRCGRIVIAYTLTDKSGKREARKHSK